MKPSVISHLQKDKSIYAIDGYVDTLNWVNDTVSNLKADNGVKIRWIDDSHPVIELDSESNSPSVSKPEGKDGIKLYNVTIGGKKFISVGAFYIQ